MRVCTSAKGPLRKACVEATTGTHLGVLLKTVGTLAVISGDSLYFHSLGGVDIEESAVAPEKTLRIMAHAFDIVTYVGVFRGAIRAFPYRLGAQQKKQKAYDGSLGTIAVVFLFLSEHGHAGYVFRKHRWQRSFPHLWCGKPSVLSVANGSETSRCLMIGVSELDVLLSKSAVARTVCPGTGLEQ